MLPRKPTLPVTLLYAASLAVPAALFAFFAAEEHAEAIDDAYRKVEQTTGLLQEHALKVLEINASALERTAQYVRTADRRSPDYPRKLNAWLAEVEHGTPSIHSLTVFAADGSATASSQALPTSDLRVDERDYFAYHRSDLHPAYFVSGPLAARTDGRTQFVLTRRLDDEHGGFAGVAASGIHADHFARQWQRLSPDRGSSIALVRDDGAVLARHPPLPIDLRLPAQSDYMQAVLREPEGTREMQSSYDGKPRIVGFRRLAGVPVSIAYAVTLDAVHARWYRTMLTYALVCGTAALALLGMSGLVHRSYRSEQRLIDRLRQTDRSRTRFFADLSHELRTPLALVLGPVQRLMRVCPAGTPEHQELELIERNATVLLRRVNDLLDVARVEAGGEHVDWRRIELARLVRLVASCFESAAAEAGLELVVQAPASLPAEADPRKVERIVFNLLSNAFKFTPAPGRVEVSLAAEAGYAVLAVQDTGPGVPEDQRSAVFERFRQVEGGPQRVEGGSGLGLTIVREFAQLHGGSVLLDAAPGGGARFTVRLPLRAPAGVPVRDGHAHRPLVAHLKRQVAAERHPKPERLEMADDGDDDTPSVLVVEDHPEMNAFLVQALASRYRVASARDGGEGLEQALGPPVPDLIVLDMAMPVMNGEVLIERLRQERALADVPILMLTAHADEALQARVLRKGAQDFLQKPFAEEVLLERVERLLADRRRSAVLIRRCEARLKAILETAKDAIIVTDEAHRIVLFNAAAQRMFGYAAETVVGEGIDLLLPTQSGTCETARARRCDGTLFPVECATARLDGDGGFHSVILRDITARLRDRQALLDAHEELQRVTETFQQELIAAVESRQAEIARDLHDSVGAALAGVALLVGGARARPASPRVPELLDKAQEQVTATAESVRRISRGLLPTGPDGKGLLQALEQFASDLDTTGVQCTVQARGSFGALDAAAATHVFRVVQEAASNAVRHGKATRLRILLVHAGGRYRATVIDNGAGCDFERLPRSQPGLGLRSMQARARAIEGRLELQRRPHGGCRVRLCWQVPAAGVRELAAHQVAAAPAS